MNIFFDKISVAAIKLKNWDDHDLIFYNETDSVVLSELPNDDNKYYSYDSNFYCGSIYQDIIEYKLGDSPIVVNSGDSIETEFEVVDTLNLVSEEFSEISHRNLFWSDDLKSLNIVVDGVSEGLVILDEWGDEDPFTFNGSDMIKF